MNQECLLKMREGELFLAYPPGRLFIAEAKVNFEAAQLASGVYFYLLQARFLSPAEGGTGKFVDAKKLLLLR